MSAAAGTDAVTPPMDVDSTGYDRAHAAAHRNPLMREFWSRSMGDQYRPRSIDDLAELRAAREQADTEALKDKAREARGFC